MEEYLHNLKHLRSQMTDMEDEVEKQSIEEQKLKTAVDAMDKDLLQVKSESKRLNEEAVEMTKARDQICVQIVGKQQSAFEAEIATLLQTLELVQQDLLSVSLRLKEKRLYYTKFMDELSVKLRDQQDWLKSQEQKLTADDLSIQEETNRGYGDLVTQLESAKPKLENVHGKISEIALESSKVKQLMEQVKRRIDGVPPELEAMDVMALEEEHKALMTDKAGETEYSQSLHDQIQQLKGISHVVKCQCGEEYQVGLMV